MTGSPNRENFDITAGYQGAGSNVHPFVDAGTQLAESVQSFISDAAKDIEHEYGMHDFSENVQRSTVFLRFLHYFGNPSTGDVIAEPHTDQSGFTLHLSETDHGCERMDPKSRQWSSMPVEDGKAVLFGAMQLQLLTDCEIPALTHRVVATEKTKIAGRFAIVAFVRIANVPVYNKTAHGRLQERMPGFQYDMKPNEFAELFVARHN